MWQKGNNIYIFYVWGRSSIGASRPQITVQFFFSSMQFGEQNFKKGDGFENILNEL